MVYWTAVYIFSQATEKLLIVCKAQNDFMYILSTYLHTTKYWLLRLQKCYVLHIETCGLSWQIIDEFNNLFQIQGSCPRLLMNQNFLKKSLPVCKASSCNHGECNLRTYTYSITQEICTRFLLCCALLWLYIDWFSHIHQAYFTGTVAI